MPANSFACLTYFGRWQNFEKERFQGSSKLVWCHVLSDDCVSSQLFQIFDWQVMKHRVVLWLKNQGAIVQNISIAMWWLCFPPAPQFQQLRAARDLPSPCSLDFPGFATKVSSLDLLTCLPVPLLWGPASLILRLGSVFCHKRAEFRYDTSRTGAEGG